MNVPAGTSSISIPDARSRTRQASPDASIAARSVGSVTTFEFGRASSSVAHARYAIGRCAAPIREHRRDVGTTDDTVAVHITRAITRVGVHRNHCAQCEQHHTAVSREFISSNPIHVEPFAKFRPPSQPIEPRLSSLRVTHRLPSRRNYNAARRALFRCFADRSCQ